MRSWRNGEPNPWCGCCSPPAAWRRRCCSLSCWCSSASCSPRGRVSAPAQAHLLSVARNPLTRIVLLGLCVLALFHWAHRFRYTLYEGLQLKHLSKLIIVGCYGAALVGSALAVYLLLTGL